MARSINKLTAAKVSALSKPGNYGDGAGLFLQITPTGTKSWTFKYMKAGRARQMGLGSINTFTLAKAREKAREARQQLHEGDDPLDAKAARKAEAFALAVASVTFEQAAERYIAAKESGWKNAKHAAQVRSTLATYAFPLIGKLHVDKVDTGHVINILEPIWSTKTETATRVRQRIENTLDWAKSRGFRKGENPARWKGHLDNLLPKPSKVAKEEHHAALPYAELSAFMAALREKESVSANALEFLILTAARTGEVIAATDSEIDMEARLWVVPKGRMKSGVEHRVPLCSRAIEILKTTPRENGSPFLFPGFRSHKGLSNMAMLQKLRGMKGYDQYVVHGFRSTFRDWAGDMTNFPRDVIETALAHVIKDKAEAAYRRSDAIEKRRRLMEAWGVYCGTAERGGANVTPIRAVSKVQRKRKKARSIVPPFYRLSRRI